MCITIYTPPCTRTWPFHFYLIFAHELILGLEWERKQDILNINKYNNFNFIYWILLYPSGDLNFYANFIYFVNLLQSIFFLLLYK